jgi:hypothetical protein
MVVARDFLRPLDFDFRSHCEGLNNGAGPVDLKLEKSAVQNLFRRLNQSRPCHFHHAANIAIAFLRHVYYAILGSSAFD